MRESYTSALAVGIEARYRKLEQEIMEDVVRRIQKSGHITSTADWELNRYLMLGKSSRDLEKLISSAVAFNDEEVERLYAEVIANEYTIYKKQYEEITGEFIPYEENYRLQQLVESMQRQTAGELYNITKSMGFMIYNGSGKKVFTPLSDIYNDYLDQAMVDLTSGVFDYNTIIRRVTKELTDSGLRTDHAFKTNPTDYTGIDYPSGWHNRIDVAARRAVLTGASQLSGRITDMNAERLGVTHFEVSHHYGARPDHAAWQGKVYTKQQLIDICGLGTGAGLLGWNCRHEYYLFFPGSKRTYTDKQLAEMNAAEARKTTFKGKEYNSYEATQKQRQMETNMRAQRSKISLLTQAGADPDDIMIEKCRYQAQLEEYKAFSATMRLKEQRERIHGDLKGRIAPTARQYAIHKDDANLIREAHAAGIGGKVHITPTKLDFSTLQYDQEHITARGHNVTEEEARRIIRNASISVTVWGGQYERYYSVKDNAAVYVDRNSNSIRTAYKGEEVAGSSARLMEVLKKYGKG